jgi:iron complex transport system ATP-binding protein
MDKPDALFRMRDLTFSYGESPVLRNVTVDIHRSAFTTIVGPNGAGKTTLLNLLNGYLKPSGGSILFGDRPLGECGVKELGREIALVPQETQFRFPFTCLDVVMMGRAPFTGRMERASDEDLAFVEACMEMTDTIGFVDKSITELSGGEKQRVILAKALAQTPKVMLLDEPFSAMDMHYMLDFLHVLRRGTEEGRFSVVAVMHDLHVASSFSGHVVALDGGRAVRSGRAQEVLTPAFVEELYGVRVERFGRRGLVLVTDT